MATVSAARVGQIWEDLDVRCQNYQVTGARRRVQVVGLEQRRGYKLLGYDTYVKVQDLRTGRRTWIREDRLVSQTGHGAGRGYRLVKNSRRRATC